MKIKTTIQLQDELDREFAWRLKELADLKVEARKASSNSTVIRAGLPLAYAHWEGFVKNSAEYYLEYVQNQSVGFNELAPCFVALGARKFMNEFEKSNKPLLHSALVRYLYEGLTNGERVKFGIKVNTKANLNSEVFEDIACCIGIDTSPYQTRYKFIDQSLLKRRNEIAHGQYLDLDAADFTSLLDDVISLLRSFKDSIENNVTLKTFLRPTP